MAVWRGGRRRDGGESARSSEFAGSPALAFCRGWANGKDRLTGFSSVALLHAQLLAGTVARNSFYKDDRVQGTVRH